MTALRNLGEEVQKIRSLLIAQEIDTIPEFTGKSKKNQIQDSQEIDKDRQEYKEYKDLKKRLLEWDDELATLAESLVAKPKVNSHYQSLLCSC